MRKVVRIQDPSITTSLVKQNLKSTPADKAFKWMLRLVVVRNQEREGPYSQSLETKIMEMRMFQVGLDEHLVVEP